MNLRAGCAVQMITSLYIHHSHTLALFFFLLIISFSLSLSIYIYILTEREKYYIYIPGTSECLLFGGLLPCKLRRPTSPPFKTTGFYRGQFGGGLHAQQGLVIPEIPGSKRREFFSDLSRDTPQMVVKSKGSVPKVPLNSGLGIILICPEV